MRSTIAKIHAEVDGTPGQDDMPGALVFSTTPDGSASPYDQERMRITASGHLGLGVTPENWSAAVTKAIRMVLAVLFQVKYLIGFLS